jgi:hypothetical protein
MMYEQQKAIGHIFNSRTLSQEYNHEVHKLSSKLHFLDTLSFSYQGRYKETKTQNSTLVVPMGHTSEALHCGGLVAHPLKNIHIRPSKNGALFLTNFFGNKYHTERENQKYSLLSYSFCLGLHFFSATLCFFFLEYNCIICWCRKSGFGPNWTCRSQA